MKKVVSALTAAAMCASMAASAASVFAFYNTEDMTFSLRVAESSVGTVSADGSTITFASAAEAANATFVVGQYLECDPAKVFIQQVGGCVSVSDNAVGISAADGIDLNNPYYSAAKTYTKADGTEFSTDCFVNTFAYTAGRKNNYKSGAGMASFGDSSTWPAEWGYADKTKHLIWTWASDLGDTSATEKTAYFIGAKSDDFPLMAFKVTLDAGIKDGTYTIDWVDKYTNDYGLAQATFFSAGSQDTPAGIPVMTPVGTLKSLNIVVGEASAPATTTAKPAETTKPTETTKPAETTPPVQSTTADTPVKPTGHTWSMNKAVMDDERYAYIEAFVANDPGTNGFTVAIEIQNAKGEWVSLKDFGLVYSDSSNGGAYPTLGAFFYNPENSSVASADMTTVDPQYAIEDKPVFSIEVEVPESIPDGVYKTRIKDDYKIAFIETLHTPTLVEGSLVVGADTPDEPEETTTAKPAETTKPTETTAKPAETTKPTETIATTEKPADTDYLYGDVNKNGKVELVDIVMLNRNLTGYGDQKLDAYQTEVADCYDDAKLDGKDSMEILKYLLGLNKALPTAAK